MAFHQSPLELSTLSISDSNANEVPVLIKTVPLSKRAPASRRMRSTFTNTEFNVPPIGAGSGAPPPSRKREQAEALENLRKKISPALLRKDYGGTLDNALDNAKEKDDEDERPLTREEARKQAQLDNRPQLLQKILHTRSLCLVSEGEEGCTAWQDSDFISDALCWHNVYRQRHGAPALTMSPELCSFAQTWANHLAHTNKFYYRSDREVGQNLFCRPANVIQTEVTGQEVSTYWYGAVKQYDFFKEPDVLHANVNAGHFTQMVWASTRHFGIGKARSRSGKILIVAHYAPPGNISGYFSDNVRPPGFEGSEGPPSPSLLASFNLLQQQQQQQQQQEQEQAQEEMSIATSSTGSRSSFGDTL
ncbi:uncharacterized protein LOC113378110 [Ctenocephalides felis]|uniref:uncharacterized protein LOC113378110 n=1 Tax=Ctenocephalides felis TaxID=7515 RepID=UPI000E6E2390|nr:uncharacterized protein LOC113378110 [Ctenocephalides felis]